MNYLIKDALDSQYEICDYLQNMTIDLGFPDFNDEMSFKDLVHLNLSRFLFFLAGQDGEITDDEVDFINIFLDYDMSLLALQNLFLSIEDDFEEQVPFCVQLMVEADKVLTNLGASFGTPGMIDLFQVLGNEFINHNKVATDWEEYMLKKYIDTMYSYYNETFGITSDSNNSLQNINNVVETDTNESTFVVEESLEELMYELNSLTGLDNVKNDVNSIINLLKIRKMREERGIKQTPMSLHLVFSGNPGTGKTTVARLLSKIYYHLGVLSKGHLVEVDRSGLVSGYVGQTAIKVNEVIQKSLGGVLFIDEAYSLTVNRGETDFGFEAVDTLLKGMEDHRNDLIVIVAGYPNLMNEFLSSNPGLRSRFNKFINFEDYNAEELKDIFVGMCKKSGYEPSFGCLAYVQKFFQTHCLKCSDNFANARDVRNFFEQALINQANRLSTDIHITDEELVEITMSDVVNIVL